MVVWYPPRLQLCDPCVCSKLSRVRRAKSMGICNSDHDQQGELREAPRLACLMHEAKRGRGSCP